MIDVDCAGVTVFVVDWCEHPGTAMAPPVVVERDPAEGLAAGLGFVGEASGLECGGGLSLVGREERLGRGVIAIRGLLRFAVLETDWCG
jgi:hypothetical protein